MADYVLSVKIEGDASDLQREAKGAMSSIDRMRGNLGKMSAKLRDGLGFGVLMGIGQKAFDRLTSAASEFVGELESTSAAWQTFEKNAEMNGHAAEEIQAVKKELQDFATQTIYSASDMATTYAQLDAVGIKSAESLVKGFGGIAAAAENPAQAMKTLSQQGVQMAAKPKVAWQDFKLMLEQTPAGIAAVAKEMGMTTSQMVQAVQDGKIKTDAFFDAVEKVGTSDSFTELATKYKTADQAMDGLQETITNKLMPSFELLQDKAIDCIEGIIEKVDSFDGEGLKAKVESVVSAFESGGLGGAIEAVGGLLGGLPPQIKEVGSAIGAITAVNVAQGILSSDTWQTCVGGIEAVKGAAADLPGKLQNLPQIVGTKFTEMGGVGKKTLADISAETGKTMNELRSEAMKAAYQYQQTGMSMSDAMKRAYAEIGVGSEKAAGGFGSALQAMSANVSAFTGGVKTKAGQIWEVFSQTKVGQVVSTVGSGLGKVGGVVVKTGAVMMNGLVSMMSMAMQMIMPAALIGAALAGLGLLYEHFGGQIDGLIELAITKGPEVIKGLADGISSRIPGLISKGAELVGKFADVIIANLPAIIAGGAEIIISLVQGVAASAPTLMGKITQVIGTLITSLAQVMPQLLTAGMQILQAIAQGISENLPVLIDFAFQAIQMLITGFSENLPQILAIAVQIIMMLVQGLTEHLPELIDMAITLITMLANAFIENLPLFIAAAVQIITALASALIENLPLLIDGAMQIIEALLNVFLETDWLGLGKQVLDAIGQGLFGDDWAGIKEALKAQIDHIKQTWEEFKENTKQKFEEIKEGVKQKILDMVRSAVAEFGYFYSTTKEKFEEIKETIKEKVENAKEKAVETFQSMVEGVKEKAGDIKDSIEEGFNNAIDYITSLPGQAYDWGADIIENIADGIWGAIGSVVDAAASVADTIWSYLHFSEPEIGPLSDFHTWMPDLMSGLAQGMKSGLPTLKAGVDLVANTMSGIIPGTGTAGRYDGGDNGGTHNNWGGVSIVVNAAEGQDEEAVADAVMRRMLDLVAAEV